MLCYEFKRDLKALNNFSWKLNFFLVGAPMEIPVIENPKQEEIDEYHEKFTDHLIDLFESEKSKYLNNHESVSLTFEWMKLCGVKNEKYCSLSLACIIVFFMNFYC